MWSGVQVEENVYKSRVLRVLVERVVGWSCGGVVVEEKDGFGCDFGGKVECGWREFLF